MKISKLSPDQFYTHVRRNVRVMYMRVSRRYFKRILAGTYPNQLQKITIDNPVDFDNYFSGIRLPYFHGDRELGYDTKYQNILKSSPEREWFSKQAHNHYLETWLQKITINDKVAKKQYIFDPEKWRKRAFGKNGHIIAVVRYNNSKLLLDGVHRITGMTMFLDNETSTRKVRELSPQNTLKKYPITVYELHGRIAMPLFPFDLWPLTPWNS